jgi:hypothetical protein
MIRTEMAFAAGLRLPRLRLRETMPRMAGAAAAGAAIRIDPADARVGPRRRVKFAVWEHLYRRSMTLETTNRDRWRTADDFSEKIIE